MVVVDVVVIGKGMRVVSVVEVAGPMTMVLLLLLLLRCSSMMVIVIEPQMAGSSDVCRCFLGLIENDQR